MKLLAKASLDIHANLKEKAQALKEKNFTLPLYETVRVSIQILHVKSNRNYFGWG